MLVLLITAGSGERRAIGRFDSVSLSAGIWIFALIGKGVKALNGSGDSKNGRGREEGTGQRVELH